MSRVPWKENKVISIETRRNVFVLAQMIQSPYLIVYNAFRDKDNWDDIDLRNVPVLLCTAVTRQFISNSNVVTQRISPVIHNNLPKYWIAPFPESRRIKVWEDTPDEREFFIIGEGGSLIERDIMQKGFDNSKVIAPSISFNDDKTIDGYELNKIRIYAEFNERLYLCHLLEKNVDPDKDLIFNRDIPKAYKAYIGIISGTLAKEEWYSL